LSITAVERSSNISRERGAQLEDLVDFRARFSVAFLIKGPFVHRFFALDPRVSFSEIFEALSVRLVVGGSIVIPHLSRAVDGGVNWSVSQ
jgi:hypothetical protein